MKYLKDLFFSFIWIIGSLLILTLFFSFFNYFNIISDKIMPIIKIIILFISLFLGGLYIGKKSKNKGWLEGIKLGIIFSLFLLIFNFLALNNSFKLKYLLFYTIIIISSIFGSIIGINKKSNN